MSKNIKPLISEVIILRNCHFSHLEWNSWKLSNLGKCVGVRVSLIACVVFFEFRNLVLLTLGCPPKCSLSKPLFPG